MSNDRAEKTENHASMANKRGNGSAGKMA